MTQRTWAATILSLAALQAHGADYGPIQTVGGAGCSSCQNSGAAIAPRPGAVLGQRTPMLDPTPRPTFGPTHTCNWTESQKTRSDRVQKLVEFMLYRPTIPCDCLPRPTGHVPPLNAWFPNTCSASAADCSAPCAKRLQRSTGGCATCAASIGTPVKMHGAQHQPAPATPTALTPLPTMRPTIQPVASPVPPRQHTTLARPSMPPYYPAPRAMPQTIQQPAVPYYPRESTPSYVVPSSPYGGMQPAAYPQPQR